MEHANIIVVEDQKIIARDIQATLNGFGYKVPEVAFSGEEALDLVEKRCPDMMVVDIRLGKGMDGIDLAKKIRQSYDVPVVYLTAYSDDMTLQRAKETEPYGYLMKPYDCRELFCTIEVALSKHEAEKKMRDDRKKTKEALMNISLAVLISDEKGHVTFMNHETENITGWRFADAEGTDVKEVFQIAEDETDTLVENPIDKILSRGSTINTDRIKIITKDGKKVSVCGSLAAIRNKLSTGEHRKGSISGCAFVFCDITERKRMQEEVISAYKKEAVGMVAGDIACRINLPLQSIQDSTLFLRDAFDDLTLVIKKHQALRNEIRENGDVNKATQEVVEAEAKVDITYLTDEIPHSIDDIFEGIGKLNRILQNIVSNANPDQVVTVNADVHKILGDILADTKNEYDYVADVKTDFAKDLPSISCYPDELNRALRKLIMHVVYAIIYADTDGSKKRGLISIKTRQEKDAIVIWISDKGAGVPEKMRDRIFDTSKDEYKGIGQGLSTVYSTITNDHGGSITFTTEEGRGTTFEIRLPIHRKGQKAVE